MSEKALESLERYESRRRTRTTRAGLLFAAVWLLASVAPAVLSLEPDKGLQGAGDLPPATNLDFSGARGHVNQSSFFSDGQIDSINTMNGNLVVKIPIGQRYPAGPSFNWGLTLAYNSNAWDTIESQFPNGEGISITVPHFGTNAGMGWQLSLGMLYPKTGSFGGPAHWPNPSFGAPWLYVAPDGSKIHFVTHSGSTYYSNDGTRMRLRAVSGGRYEIDFANGETHLFVPNFSSSSCSAPGHCYRPTEMRDAFGNMVGVHYNEGVRGDFWSITDGHGRWARVDFQNAPGNDGDEGDIERVIDQIVVPAFGGSPATYDFVYGDPLTTDRDCPMPGSWTTPMTVPVLTRIVMPEAGYDYEFKYLSSTGDNCNANAAARLEEVTLPSHARIAYGYGGYDLPTTCRYVGIGQPETVRTTGVKRRDVFLDADSSNEHLSWQTFVSQLTERQSPPNNNSSSSCNRANVVQTDVRDFPAIQGKYRVTRHYHTVTRTERNTPAGVWRNADYGLAVTKSPEQAILDLFGNQLFLSEEVAACADSNFCQNGVERRTYLRHAIRPLSCSDLLDDPSCFRDEVVVMGRRQQYGTKSVDTSNTNYDGLGHFRTSQVKSNFRTGHPTEVTFTGYNRHSGTFPIDATGAIQAPMPTPAIWTLDVFDQKEVTKDGRRDVVEYDFDDKGFLSCRRTYSDTTPTGTANRSADDVSTRFVDNGSGFAAWEEYAGGDHQTVTTASICPALASSYETRLRHTYTFGRRSTSQYYRPKGGTIGPLLTDLEIDPSTGLTAKSTDHSVLGGLATVLSFDLLSRKTSETTLANTPSTTSLTYSLSAAGSGGGMVNIRTDAAGQMLTHFQLYYDGLGREFKARAETPAGWVTQKSAYNAQGWLRKRSTVQLEPDFDWSTDRSNLYRKYDVHGRVGEIIDAGDGYTRIVWAGGGIHKKNVRRYYSGGQKKNVEHYDAFGRVWKESRDIYPQNGTADRVLERTWNGDVVRDRLRNASDSASQSRRRWLDGRGFAYRESMPEKTQDVTFTYDARGKVRSRTESGTVTTFVYDRAERLLRVNAGGTLLKEFSYNNQGRVDTATRFHHFDTANTFGFTTGLGGQVDFEVTEDFTYNDLGLIENVDTEIDFNGVTMAAAAQAWEYDPLGRVTESHYPSCGSNLCGGAPSRTTKKSYTLGFLTQINQLSGPSPGFRIDQGFHGNGVLARIDYLRGTTPETWDEIRTEEDGWPRIKGVFLHRSSDNAVLASTGTNQFNSVGNLSVVSGDLGSTYYEYDIAERLTGVRNDKGHLVNSFSYDTWDNLLNSDGGPAISVNSQTNRLNSVGGEAAVYDGRGNLLRLGSAHMSYDALDRQLAWSDHSPGSNPLSSYTYQVVNLYNASNQRVMTFDRVRDNPGAPDNNFATTTLSLRDLDGNLQREYRQVELYPPTYTDYIWHGRELRAIDQNGRLRFAHVDRLDSVRALTEGTAVTAESFRPFGSKHVPRINAKIGFTGHELNRTADTVTHPVDGTGTTMHMRTREYWPTLGRFSSVDPARDGWNLYSYAGNNPVNRIDPDGKAAMDPETDSAAVQFATRASQFDLTAQSVKDAIILKPSVGPPSVDVTLGAVKAKAALALEVDAKTGNLALKGEVGAEIPNVLSVSSGAKYKSSDGWTGGPTASVKSNGTGQSLTSLGEFSTSLPIPHTGGWGKVKVGVDTEPLLAPVFRFLQGEMERAMGPYWPRTGSE